MNEKGILTPRPHARIITMIGEQLIRNEKVALMELIKNSYDADASWVQIRFINFDRKEDTLNVNKDSIIEIEDDGIGMSLDTIKASWINPASPFKYLLKQEGKEKTKRGRVIQGEKGIGRFAGYKLGATIELFTRAQSTNAKEVYLKSDLSGYDAELITRKDKKDSSPIYIDDIEYIYEERAPKIIAPHVINIKNSQHQRAAHGTLIRITNLRNNWTTEKLQEVVKDCLKLISPFSPTDFTYDVLLNGSEFCASEDSNRLNDLLDLAPLKIRGEVDDAGIITYSLGTNKKQETKKLGDMATNREIKEHFFDKKGNLKRAPTCGPFKFKFYVFDLERRASLESHLSNDDREIIKSHRVYLYRDGIRVYPYGDPTDDWLEIDIKRGTIKAGGYLSNDQIVGYIEISNKENPNLRDKTNREGLMDIGYGYEDLKAIILGILGFLRTEFAKYKVDKDDKAKKAESEGLLFRQELVKDDIDALSQHFKNINDSKGEKILKALTENYHKEIDVFSERVEVVEDLAGVGITVDAASHDLMAMMDRAKESLNILFEMSKANSVNVIKFREELEKLRGQFAFIEDQLHGIQPLFRSSRRQSKQWRIKDIIEKVKLYYSVPMKERHIQITIEEKYRPLVVKSVEGILLQVFINLLDNAVYWLTATDSNEKNIKIIINGSTSEVIFADNGPGISVSDAAYVFKPFFSTKGVRGRGLGLYITRQLLERYDFSIDLLAKKKVLSGANFRINFSDSQGEDESNG